MPVFTVDLSCFMAMDDRDYYREHHAKKKGLIYNRRNATYSADPRYFPKPFRCPSAEPLVVSTVTRPALRPWHPVLIVLLTASICLAVFVVLKLISKFA